LRREEGVMERSAFSAVFGFEPLAQVGTSVDPAGVEIVRRILRQLEAEAVAADEACVAARRSIEETSLCSVSDRRLRRLRKKWLRSQEKARLAYSRFREARALATSFHYLAG